MKEGHRLADQGGRGKGREGGQGGQVGQGAQSRRVRPGGQALVRNTVINLIGQVAPLIVAVVAVPTVVRGLGDARFGLLSLAWVVLGYFGIFDLGMGRAATKYVADALGREDESAIPPIVWSAVLVQVIFGLLGGIILAVGTPLLVGRFLSISPELVGEALRSFYLLAIAVPLVLVASSFRGVLEAAQRFDLINLVRVPSSIANYLLALIGILAGYGLPAIMVLLVVSRAGAALAFAILAFRVFPEIVGRIGWERGTLRKLLGFGGWVTVSSMTIPVLTYVEHFLIAGVISVGALTYYSVPYEMVSRVAIFPASIAMTLFPAFGYYQASRAELIAELSWRPLRYLVVVGMPVLLALALFAPEILELWLGGEFAMRSSWVLRVLALSFFLNALAHIPFSSVQGLGRPDLKAKLDLVGVPLLILLAWFLIPRYGVLGAALAKLGATAFDTVGLFWMSARIGAFSPLRESWRSLRPAILVTTGYGAASLVALTLPGGAGGVVSTSLLGRIGLMALITLIYGVMVWRVVLDTRDRTLIATILAARRGRGADPSSVHS